MKREPDNVTGTLLDYIMIALLDMDTVAYRCAASCEPNKTKLEREPLDLAIRRADELCYRILNTTEATEYRGFLTGTENFRKELYPDYKTNRAKVLRPAWLDDVRNFLIEEWEAEVCAGYEADDGIAMSVGENTIICANDKDFKQLEGQHYNFVKDEFFTVDSYEASLALWTQLLVGDSSDNVAGIPGIGPIKAKKLLSNISAEEMESVVRNCYENGGFNFEVAYYLFKLVRSKKELEEVENFISKIKGKTSTEEST
jgi:5'-3' exonuclease